MAPFNNNINYCLYGKDNDFYKKTTKFDNMVFLPEMFKLVAFRKHKVSLNLITRSHASMIGT